MADLKFSTAPAADALTGAEAIPVTQSGASKATTAGAIAALAAQGPASSADNAVARFDNAGGATPKTVQDSAVFVSDASGAGTITFAPRDTSGQIAQLGGATSAFPGLYYFSTDARLDINRADDSGLGLLGVDTIWFLGTHGTTPRAEINSAGQYRTSYGYRFSSSSTDCRSDDGGISRAAPATMMLDGAVSGDGAGWMRWAGESYLAADATNATANLAPTGLSITVKGGRHYAFKCVLYVSDSTATEGVKIDFGGGSATATNFRAHVTGFDTALTINTQVTSLTGGASAGTFTGAGMLEIHGSLEPSADGTFIPRFAQNAHAVGTLTLFRGSHLLMWETP